MAWAGSPHGIVRWAAAGLVFGMLALPASASLPPLTGVVQVAGGESHTCALTQAGAVKCWGHNQKGQLGDGGTVDRALPVEVVGLGSGVLAVSVGGDHSCALTVAGAVKCWGGNAFGQLGDGTTIDRHAPVQVFGLASGVQAISAGHRAYTCALGATGAVLCWGANDLGSLGNGNTAHSNVPTLVWGLSSGVRAISAGNAHACAILTAGNGLKCWGYNLGGQIGDGSLAPSTVPVDVVGMGSGVASVAAGVLHTCAVTSGGAARCWGNNFYAQLGDGDLINRPVPGDVSGLGQGVAGIVAGHQHSCARMQDGTARCWGGNYFGQLGLGAEIDERRTAVPVPVLGSGVLALAAGSLHTCAIASGGGLRCWGNNDYGQLGHGDVAWPTYRLTPVDVVGLAGGVQAIEAGIRHSCALTTAGAVRCWGGNNSGQLGDGTDARRFAPVSVAGLGGTAQALGLGDNHSCAVVAGTVKCWGSNRYNQLGVPANTALNPPTTVPGLSGTITRVSAGRDHTASLNSAGTVRYWGHAEFGGGGGPTGLIDLFNDIRAVSAGGRHNCVLTFGGVVKCWGDNQSGQFGYYGDNSYYQTVVVQGLSSGVQALSAGAEHTCALSAGGRVECWGASSHGQGGGPMPVNFLGLESGIAAVSAGDSHNCVLTSGGAVKCWGNNRFGQLGNGGTANAFLPVDVAGLSSGVQAISAGAFHTCALTQAGAVKCWGDNASGQMGDGRFPGVALPQPVLVDPAFFRDGFEGEGGA